MSRIDITSLTASISVDASQIDDDTADALIETLERAMADVADTMRKAYINYDIDSARTTIE